MTPEQLTAAEDLARRITGPFELDGRTIGNADMWRLMALTRHRRQERFDTTGVCCDAPPYSSGRCPHGRGQCHLFTIARKLRRKTQA